MLLFDLELYGVLILLLKNMLTHFQPFQNHYHFRSSSQGLLDKAPTGLATTACTNRPLFLRTPGAEPTCILSVGSPLPAKLTFQASVKQSQGYFQILTDGGDASVPENAAPKSSISSFFFGSSGANATPGADSSSLGEVVFALPASTEIPAEGVNLDICISLSREEGLAVDVTLGDSILASLKVPSA